MKRCHNCFCEWEDQPWKWWRCESRLAVYCHECSTAVPWQVLSVGADVGVLMDCTSEAAPEGVTAQAVFVVPHGAAPEVESGQSCLPLEAAPRGGDGPPLYSK